jgi:hypothetical protein
VITSTGDVFSDVAQPTLSVRNSHYKIPSIGNIPSAATGTEGDRNINLTLSCKNCTKPFTHNFGFDRGLYLVSMAIFIPGKLQQGRFAQQ